MKPSSVRASASKLYSLWFQELLSGSRNSLLFRRKSKDPQEELKLSSTRRSRLLKLLTLHRRLLRNQSSQRSRLMSLKSLTKLLWSLLRKRIKQIILNHASKSQWARKSLIRSLDVTVTVRVSHLRENSMMMELRRREGAHWHLSGSNSTTLEQTSTPAITSSSLSLTTRVIPTGEVMESPSTIRGLWWSLMASTKVSSMGLARTVLPTVTAPQVMVGHQPTSTRLTTTSASSSVGTSPHSTSDFVTVLIL